MNRTHRIPGSRSFNLLAGLIALWSFAGLAVPASAAETVPRIGYFVARGPDPTLDDPFNKGLRDLGYVEGRNIIVVRRFAYNKADALTAIARELSEMKLDVIVVAPHDAALAMKQATAKTPIVMATGADPVGAGLIQSLRRPGGNVTGMTNIAVDLIGKEFQLLKELVPARKSVGFLAVSWNPVLDNYLSEARAAAKELGLELHVAQIKDPDGLEGAFQELARKKAGALFASVDPMLFAQRARIAELALKYRIPTSTPWAQYAAAGGLIAYGPKLSENFYRAANYVDMILRGANPAELPVQQPTSFELVINLKTARALGMQIPANLLLRADKVIE